MPGRQKPEISTRKLPKQARSSDLVAAVLEAAVQLLQTEGAHRFTTARVAERAGVSVGSLYQYFPNKAAILFRLQSDEWRQTATLLRDILNDDSLSPPDRLRKLVHAFIRSECDEAAIRVALGDAAPLYRDAPEAGAAREAGRDAFRTFLREALPVTSDAERTLAGDLIAAALSAVGKAFSSAPRSSAEINTYGDAMADMLCAYLSSLEGKRPDAGAPPVGHGLHGC